MRTIERTRQIKTDYKREMKGPHRANLQENLTFLVALLAEDELLSQKYRDHALTGDGKDFRDRHIEPDLVLIYHKPDAATLRLVRLGSRSELSL